jgi:hypothetical protein
MIVKKAFVQATLLWVAGIIFTLAFSRWGWLLCALFLAVHAAVAAKLGDC